MLLEEKPCAQCLREAFKDLIEGFTIQQLSTVQQAFSSRPEMWGDELEQIQAELTRRKDKEPTTMIDRLEAELLEEYPTIPAHYLTMWRTGALSMQKALEEPKAPVYHLEIGNAALFTQYDY